MKSAKASSQSISTFLEWLISTKHLVIAKWKKPVNDDDEEVESLEPVHFGPFGMIESLLGEYFNVDLKKAEAERQAILDDFRKRQEVKH